MQSTAKHETPATAAWAALPAKLRDRLSDKLFELAPENREVRGQLATDFLALRAARVVLRETVSAESFMLNIPEPRTEAEGEPSAA